jgi:hypothetical protein
MAVQVIPVGRVERILLRRVEAYEHVMRGRGHGRLAPTRGPRNLHVVRLETPVDGLDRVVHGRLHETQVEPRERRRRRDLGFDSDRIPISDGISAGRRYPSRG